MHPLLAKSGRLGVYLIAWIPLTFILGILLVLGGALSPLEAGVLSPLLTGVYAFVCLSSWYVCRAVPLSVGEFYRPAGTLGLASLIGASLWVLWGATVATGLGFLAGIPQLASFATLADRYARSVPIVFLLGTLLYILVVALHYVLISFETARLHERRESDLAALAREAELRALKEQLNPHFLFNSLNSISALTTANPARAREMCLLLADFFRKTLGLSDRASIPLGEEIALAQSYLAVEKVRFGERLRIEEDVDPRALDCEVPPLLLQPLVENAVKHGVSGSLDGGTVRILAVRSGGRIRIAIENIANEGSASAPPETVGRTAGKPQGMGLGLSNVKRRLGARYGSDGEFHEHRREGFFSIEILLPAEAREA